VYEKFTLQVSRNDSGTDKSANEASVSASGQRQREQTPTTGPQNPTPTRISTRIKIPSLKVRSPQPSDNEDTDFEEVDDGDEENWVVRKRRSRSKKCGDRFLKQNSVPELAKPGLTG
jgi:hypothetical protein